MKKQKKVNADFEIAFAIVLKQIEEAKERVNKHKDSQAIEWLTSRGFIISKEVAQ